MTEILKINRYEEFRMHETSSLVIIGKSNPRNGRNRSGIDISPLSELLFTVNARSSARIWLLMPAYGCSLVRGCSRRRS